MPSQEEQVTGEPQETTPAEDTAKFAEAFDALEAEDSGQASEEDRHEEGDKAKIEEPDKAGQGDAEAGQPDAPSPTTDADEASRDKTSDDVWAKADPALREAHENELKAAEEKVRRAQQSARSNGGRLAKALNELAALRKAGPSDEDATTKRKERIAKIREEAPEEVAGPLIEVIEGLEEQVEGLSKSATARAETEVEQALDDELEALRERHPDFGEIVKAGSGYAEWLEQQPPSTRRIVEENAKHVVSAADAGKVFDDFKRDTGWGKSDSDAKAEAEAQRRAEQLDAGRTATGTTQPGVRSDARGKDGQDFGDAWDELERDDRRKAASRR